MSEPVLPPGSGVGCRRCDAPLDTCSCPRGWREKRALGVATARRAKELEVACANLLVARDEARAESAQLRSELASIRAAVGELPEGVSVESACEVLARISKESDEACGKL